METVSCFLLISLSCYFYFSATFLLFSIHSLVNIRTRDFHVGFFSSVTSVPVLLGFCTLSVFPSFLSNLAHSVLCPWNPPLGVRVSAVSIMHRRSSGKWKLFWDAVWLKCCTAEWPKSVLCAGDSSDRAVSCRGAELDAACGSTGAAGNLGFPRTEQWRDGSPRHHLCPSQSYAWKSSLPRLG